MASAVIRTSSRGRGASSGPKWVISLALPDFATLSWAMTRPGMWGDRGQQVHFLLAAGLGELAFLAVHRDRAAGGDVSGIAGHGRIQPGVQRVRAEPAVLPFLAEALGLRT